MSNVDLLTASPDYLKTYSLTCEPFANNLDGRFFYGGSALMQHLDLLSHLTQFGDSVILVSGPPGSGKTTMLGRFAGQASNQWRLCLINADEFEQFQQRLGDALGISDTDNEQQILERWASQTEASQLLVIVIDNSEQLQSDALQKLCSLLNHPLAERIRLILFGTPEAQQALKQSLDQKELPCNAQLLEVPRLTEEETSSYLMYRLAVAGYSGESPFTATEIRAMCKAADGRPADINRLAHEALLEHQIRTRSKRLQPKKKPRKNMVLVWGLSSLLLVAIATFLGWQRSQPVPDSMLSDNQPQPVEEIPLGLPKPDAQQTPVVTADDRPGATPQPQAPTGEMLAAIETTSPATTPATPPPLSPRQEPAEEPAPDPQVQKIPVPPALPETEPAMPAPPAETPPPAPAATVETPPATTISAPAATPEAAAESPAETATAPVPAASLPHNEAWLLAQPEQNYSLQLLGTRNAESIIDYIGRHHLDKEKSAFYRGDYQGGEWYVLMYGVYPSRQAALDARAELPAKVRKNKPWPRTLKSVHRAIHAAR